MLSNHLFAASFSHGSTTKFSKFMLEGARAIEGEAMRFHIPKRLLLVDLSMCKHSNSMLLYVYLNVLCKCIRSKGRLTGKQDNCLFPC